MHVRSVEELQIRTMDALVVYPVQGFQPDSIMEFVFEKCFEPAVARIYTLGPLASMA
jgi:hypothetical protein